MQSHINLKFHLCMQLSLTAIEVAYMHLEEESEPDFSV